MMLSGERAGERIPVDSLPFRLGRGADNDLSLDEVDHVSTSHGELRQAADGSFQYVDLGSTNGSAVRRAGATGFLDLRGYRRRADHLQAGDELHLGDPTAPFRIALVFEQDVPKVPGANDDAPADTISSAYDAPEPDEATVRQPPRPPRPSPADHPGRVPPLLTQEDGLVPLDEALEAVEYAQTREALLRGQGDRLAAAGLLGVDLDRMTELLERLGIA